MQSFGQNKEILIRMEESQLEKVTKLTAKIKDRWAGADIRRVDSVGPQIGSELKKKRHFGCLL